MFFLIVKCLVGRYQQGGNYGIFQRTQKNHNDYNIRIVSGIYVFTYITAGVDGISKIY